MADNSSTELASDGAQRGTMPEVGCAHATIGRPPSGTGPSGTITTPETAIGRNTQAALQSGFAYGFAGLVDGIVERMRDELGDDSRVIATGGMATTIAPLCRTIDEVDSHLTLTGLRLIWERNT